jgi:multicomponent Na+:H+ antiporter subunit F
VAEVYLALAIAEFAVIGVLFVRLAAGPSVSDRIVALNAMSTQSALALMLYASYADRASYVDVALWMSSFSYLGAIVWSRYLERGLL